MPDLFSERYKYILTVLTRLYAAMAFLPLFVYLYISTGIYNIIRLRCLFLKSVQTKFLTNASLIYLNYINMNYEIMLKCSSLKIIDIRSQWSLRVIDGKKRDKWVAEKGEMERKRRSAEVSPHETRLGSRLTFVSGFSCERRIKAVEYAQEAEIINHGSTTYIDLLYGIWFKIIAMNSCKLLNFFKYFFCLCWNCELYSVQLLLDLQQEF